MQSIIDLIIRVMADGLVVVVVLIGAWTMLRLPAPVRTERIARGAVAGLVTLLLAKILSLFYQDAQRPFMAMGVDAKAAYLNNPGFPSDHVLFVFCITFVVWASTKDKRLSCLLLVLSTLVAIGRVVALVHTPADVIGGFVCALVAAALVYGRVFYSTKKLFH